MGRVKFRCREARGDGAGARLVRTQEARHMSTLLWIGELIGEEAVGGICQSSLVYHRRSLLKQVKSHLDADSSAFRILLPTHCPRYAEASLSNERFCSRAERRGHMPHLPKESFQSLSSSAIPSV